MGYSLVYSPNKLWTYNNLIHIYIDNLYSSTWDSSLGSCHYIWRLEGSMNEYYANYLSSDGYEVVAVYYFRQNGQHESNLDIIFQG